MAHSPKLGDLYSVELPNGKFGFCRVIEEDYLQFFAYKSDQAQFDDSLINEVAFSVPLYNSNYKDSRLTFLKNIPFTNASESLPPKTYMYDPVFEKYSIYQNGQIIPASKSDCEGLEPASVWELDHVIDRLLGKTDWVGVMKLNDQRKPR